MRSVLPYFLVFKVTKTQVTLAHIFLLPFHFAEIFVQRLTKFFSTKFSSTNLQTKKLKQLSENMKPNQQLTQSEENRKANREKCAWAVEGFDALNEAFGPLKVIKMIDDDGVVTRIK